MTSRRKFGVINGGAGQPSQAVHQTRICQCETENARSRRDAIEALVSIYETPFRSRFPYAMVDGVSVRNWGEAIAWCALHSGRNVRTIRRLWTRYKRNGVAGLARRQRNDKGTSRFFDEHPKVALFALALIQRPDENPHSIHRAITQNAAALGLPDAEIPSSETVRNWLKPRPTILPKKGQRL